MTVTITIWILANFLVLTPAVLLVRRFSYGLLPSLIYALALWCFLTVGMPFLAEPFGGAAWSFRYGFMLTLAAAPLWFVVMVRSSVGKIDRELIERQRESVEAKRADRITFYVLWVLAFIGVGGFVVNAGKTPLLQVLSNGGGELIGNASALMSVRQEATYTDLFDQIDLVFYIVPPVIALIGHILYRCGRIALLTNFISIIAAAFLAVQFLHKGPLVFLFLKLFLVEFYFRGFSVRRAFVVGVTGFALVFGMYAFYAGHYQLSMVGGILDRIFVIYIEITEFALTHWPEPYDYMSGVTFPNPKGVFAFEPVNLSAVAYEALYGGRGNAPVSALAEGYVNYGYIGMAIISGMISLWLVLLFGIYPLFKRRPVSLAIWLTLTFEVNEIARRTLFGAIDIKLISILGSILGVFIVVRAIVTKPLGASGATG